jgi:hypothetical protein
VQIVDEVFLPLVRPRPEEGRPEEGRPEEGRA